MFLGLWVVFQYVIKGTDPCTLTNCSLDETADEIYPKLRERERKRGCYRGFYLMGNNDKTSGF